MRNLNLDQFEALREVVALGSFSAAAQRLNLTQPAISLQVKQLEARLGIRLVERIGKRAFATAAGRDLLAHGRRLFDEAAAAAATARRHRGGIVGRVRIGAGATACIYILPAALRELIVNYPDLEIIVTTGNTDEIVRAVDDNALDLAVVTLPVRGERLAVTPLLDEPLVAVLPPETAAPARLGPVDFAGMPLILYERGGTTSRIIETWFARGGVAAKPVMELGSAEAIKRLVGVGLGRSILPEVSVRAEAASGELAVRPLTPALTRTLGLVHRRDKPAEPYLEVTLAAIARCSGKDPA
jgi:DNA-binding transcriptional LysR family regulator